MPYISIESIKLTAEYKKQLIENEQRITQYIPWN